MKSFILSISLNLFCVICYAQIDTDNDGMSDEWEIANGLDVNDPIDAFCDYDGDQVINLFEYQLSSDPNNESSPIKFELSPGVTESEIQDIIELSADNPTVIRFSEGIYNGIAAISNLSADIKIILQGGWAENFNDYDPFLYPTTFEGSAICGRFITQVLRAAQSETIIIEGLNILNKSIWINATQKSFISAYNCRFSSDLPTGPRGMFSLDGFFDNFTAQFINCSFLDTNTGVFFNAFASDDSVLKFMNCTMTNYLNIPNGDFNSGIRIDATDTVTVDIINSIVWDPSTFYSIDDGFIMQDAGVNQVVAKNSILSEINTDIPIFNGIWLIDTMDIWNQNPQFENLQGLHYSLSNSSPFKDRATITGIPYSGTAPDIGVNQFAYSSMRLVESIDTISPSCGLSDGSITLLMTDTNKDLEFSLSKNGPYQSTPTFINLPAGDTIVYIRTSDNCAHFQQKVTLDEKCLTICDLMLEDSDNDGMPNAWELANGLDVCDPVDAFCDNDGDHVINLFEFQLGTDPDLIGSPRIINADNISTEEELERVLERSQQDPVVVRVAEGNYSWR